MDPPRAYMTTDGAEKKRSGNLAAIILHYAYCYFDLIVVVTFVFRRAVRVCGSVRWSFPFNSGFTERIHENEARFEIRPLELWHV